MSLDAQLDHAQSIISNGTRVQRLAGRRTELLGELAEVEQELSQLLGPPPAEPAAPRAKQKCGMCGQEGHSKRTCPQRQQGGANNGGTTP